MSFYQPAVFPAARKQHRCILCYGPIFKGEHHVMQSGVGDDGWFRSRYHDECWDALDHEGDWEFTPGGGEMPERVREALKALAPPL